MAGRTVLLLEDMQKQNAATIEAVFSSRDELKRDAQERDERNERRFEVLEGVVRDNSREILALGRRMDSLEGAVVGLQSAVAKLDDRVSGLESAVQQNSQDIRALGAKLDGKADRQVVELLEHRVDGLERAGHG